MVVLLLIIDGVFLALTGLFVYESIREDEPRAPKVGLAGLGILLITALLILFVPPLRLWIGLGFGLAILTMAVFLVPWKPNRMALEGSKARIRGQYDRYDERDLVFARNRSLRPGSEEYKKYYEMHPEKEAPDAARRAKGGPTGRPGSIDSGYPPNVAMMTSGFMMPAMVGPMAEMEAMETGKPAGLSRADASRIVKGYARHIGADIVGICRTDPDWAYSKRGEIFYDNWEDWGEKIPEPLPYTVVIGTEMDHDLVVGSPHTPTVIESSRDYALGAFLTTQLAAYFSALGYKASAQHSRHYDLLMVPLAVDAGLGELGRLGYLISDKFGPRVRLFAVTTDMPLEPDKPVDLGAEVFCERCLKCGESCPSKSIPLGDQEVVEGVYKWALNAETCFEYWGKVGTDCSVCMAICPFSRPDRSVHKIARFMVRRSHLARTLLPYLDNWVYGRRWKPRPVPDWIAYPKGVQEVPEA